MEYSIEKPHIWVSLLGIHPQATLEVVSPLAGFVGSDLLAGVLATRLTEQPGSLLIDFGTNSEMALWDGQTLWVTSAAGGPAFESCGMQCGMPAEPGAIHRFGPYASGELHFEVLDGGEAKGFCGSQFEGEFIGLPGEMRQIFANLIGNAIEAIGKNGKIRLHAYAGRDWRQGRCGLRVTVADNGPGIPSEIRDNIFDPFFTTKGESGTGLGLWITSGIVENNNGILRLRTVTRAGRSGTCFSVLFPFPS